MRDLVASLRPASVKVEHKHIIGQELRGRRRGRVVTASTLEKLAYQKAVKTACKTAYKLVLRKHLGDTAMINRWSKAMVAFQANGQPRRAGRRKKQQGWAATDPKPKPRRLSGMCLFIRENYPEMDNDVGPLRKRQRLTARWLNLPEADKERFRTRAHAMMEPGAAVSFPAICASELGGGGSRTTRQTSMRAAAINTFHAMRASHEVV